MVAIVELIKRAGELLEQVKAKRPLIHQLTNYVTANDCANVTLALGASPVMADDPDEVEDMVLGASALVLNLGTLNARKAEAMLLAGKKAGEMGIPVVLDPVGVGATELRARTVSLILREVPLAAIRCNMTELNVLAGLSRRCAGVDATPGETDCSQTAMALSGKLGCVVAVTGETDVVAMGDRMLSVANGHPDLAFITGTGCMASAIVGCCCAAGKDMFLATVTGIAVMGVAGELARRSLNDGDGLGTFRIRLVDAISTMTPEKLALHARIY